MTLEQFSFQLWRRWIGPKERGQHRVGELRLGHSADLVPADGHDGAVLRKEHGIVIASMHGRNHGEEPFDILWVKTAGSHAVIFEAIAPSLTGIIGTDTALEPHRQKLGIRRSEDLLGIGVQMLQVEGGDIDMDAQQRIGAQSESRSVAVIFRRLAAWRVVAHRRVPPHVPRAKPAQW
jgi:hypothetical protein